MQSELNSYYIVRQWWDHDYGLQTTAEIIKTSDDLETKEGLEKEIAQGNSQQIIIFILKLK